MFSEIEQEEIINQFLGEEKNEEELWENPRKNAKKIIDILNEKASKHFKEIKTIETKSFTPIKNAILKYHSDQGHRLDFERYDDYWKNKMHRYTKLLEIHKNANRYVCSKERLEKTNFKILEASDRFNQNLHC